MPSKPKKDYELKLRTPKEEHQDRLDSLAAEILVSLRSHTADPAEALAILEMVFYMIYRGQGIDEVERVKGTLADFVSNVLILHATNEMKGHA